MVDLPRRVDLSRAANARYLDALAVVGNPTVSCHLLDPVSHPASLDGRRHRPLRPIAPDDAAMEAALLAAAPRPNGFRHCDVVRALPARDDARSPSAASPASSGYIARMASSSESPARIATTSRRSGISATPTALRFRHADVALMAA